MARILQDIGFVHLHVHSSYSLLEGALKIAQLAKLAAADKQPALALTDTNNLFGALEFSEKLAGSGIQPIAGVSFPSASRRPIPSPGWCRSPPASCCLPRPTRATATSCAS
jgi:DNA polymerase-3 subunit alpha